MVPHEEVTMERQNDEVTRWSSFRFKNGLIARNRIVVPPMASQTATLNGQVTEQTVLHYQRLAQSGAGLIFAEYTYIHPSGRSEPNQLGLYSEEQVEPHSSISQVIKASGAIAGIQLVHGGAKSSEQLTGMPLVGASAIAVPTKDSRMEIPKVLARSEIKNYQNWYLNAASLASRAGYQAIELHAAHGYGLNQWLSPLTNQRLDHFGGSLKNRSRMLLEICSALRSAFPELLLGVRLPGEDHLSGGLNQTESQIIAKALENLGVDFVDVSSGIGGWRRPRDRFGEGYLIPEAQAIQTQLKVPVIGVGGIQTGKYIDDVLSAGQVAFTAVGRKILQDPSEFFNKVLAPQIVGDARTLCSA